MEKTRIRIRPAGSGRCKMVMMRQRGVFPQAKDWANALRVLEEQMLVAHETQSEESNSLESIRNEVVSPMYVTHSLNRSS